MWVRINSAMKYLRYLLVMIALSAPAFACVFTYTWVPEWASLTTWLCLLVAVFSVSARMALLALVVSFVVLGLQIPTLFLLLGPLLCLFTGYRSKSQEPSRWTLVGRILLLPALAYFGVLAGISIWGVPPTVSQSCSVCGANLKNIANALDMYESEHKGAFPGNLDQLVPKYLKALPNCLGGKAISPEARVFYRHQGIELADGYGYRQVTPKRYVIWCRSHGYADHTDRLQPWYESGSGRHYEREDWTVTDGPSLRDQLAKGPSDELVLKQKVIPWGPK
jgi:hypothetical protein